MASTSPTSHARHRTSSTPAARRASRSPLPTSCAVWACAKCAASRAASPLSGPLRTHTARACGRASPAASLSRSRALTPATPTSFTRTPPPSRGEHPASRRHARRCGARHLRRAAQLALLRPAREGCRLRPPGARAGRTPLRGHRLPRLPPLPSRSAATAPACSSISPATRSSSACRARPRAPARPTCCAPTTPRSRSRRSTGSRRAPTRW